MKMNKQKRSACPINFALEAFGDLWSLLIIRDMLLFHRSTYTEFLASGENIATNILANRLENLIQNGIITKIQHPQDKRKEIYQLTQKGIDLYPIMKEIMLWSAVYDPNTNLSKELVTCLQKEDNKSVLKKFREISQKTVVT